MDLKWYCLLLPKMLQMSHWKNPLFAPVNVYKNSETHTKWQIILISTKCIQSIRHTLSISQIKRKRLGHLSFPPHAVIHDMMAALIHPGRFTINLQSQGNRQRESQRDWLLVCFSFFLLFQNHEDHQSTFFFSCACMMFIKESRFSKHYLSLKLIENMCGNASHSSHVLYVSNCQ